jgi:hypothetical protein
MLEVRVAFYFLAWLWMVQLARAAHPEATLEAIFVMFVGVAMAACSFEAMMRNTED